MKIFLLMTATLTFCVEGLSKRNFHDGKLPFNITIQGLESPYEVFTVTSLPSKKVSFSLESKDKLARFELSTSAGELTFNKKLKGNWTAPAKPGLYELTISEKRSKSQMKVNLFVLVSARKIKGEKLNGYRIGRYPKVALNGLEIYLPPKGFIEVTQNNQSVHVSPHFQLKQFLCKQKSSFPKYIVLKSKLLLKLELILQKVNEKGFPNQSLHVMSGYRTPFYNKVIKNVKYSRHLWGGAADIYLDDNPKDKMMDDLNRDGKTDLKDANVAYKIIQEMVNEPYYRTFYGGLAKYKSTKAHGPFIHVDVRGNKARWGVK